MKRIWAWILALCMISSAAAAEKIGTEALLMNILDAIDSTGSFWMDYADGATQLAGGVVMDEDGLPGAGARYQSAGADVYAALDAQGMRFSDGDETVNVTWEQLLSALDSSSVSPQLTEADTELLTAVLSEALLPVMETVQIVNSDVQLDGSPAQCTEIQLPLRAMCQTLDKSMSNALSAHLDALNDLIARNQRFLYSFGVRVRSAEMLLSNWQQLSLSELIPDEITAVIRFTESASAWKLEASVMDAGLEATGDGAHVNGRIYVGEQEWVFDTRDLEAVLGWVQELLSHISPDAFDLSFTDRRGITHLHFKLDYTKLTSQLVSGVKTVLERHSAQAQAIIDRYAPFAQLFGAEVPSDPNVETLIRQLQTSINRSLTLWRMRNAGMYGMYSSVLEADFYMADDALSLYFKSPFASADLSYDLDGMDLNATINLHYRPYGLTAHGLWTEDMLQLNGTLEAGGTVTAWGLSGVKENDALTFTLTTNNAWTATATVRDGSVEIITAAGWQSTLLWTDDSVSLHINAGEEALVASVRTGDSQFTASLNVDALDASLLVREEPGGYRARLHWQTPRSKSLTNAFELEAAFTSQQLMFKAGSYVRARMQEHATWELGVDIRPNRASGSVYINRTQAGFQWSEGSLTAQSLYRMRGLTVDTNLLIADITAQGTDFNTTQIKWDQKLHYEDETVDNSRLYTVHTTIVDDTKLHFDIVDQDGKHAEANLTLLPEAADLSKLLKLDEPQPEPIAEPEPTKAPSGGGAFLGGGPKK